MPDDIATNRKELESARMCFFIEGSLSFSIGGASDLSEVAIGKDAPDFGR